MTAARPLTAGLLCLLLLLLVGCASHSRKFAPIAAELADEDLDAALQLLDAEEPPERDRLLWLMNRGMLLRIKGDYAGSNQAFAAAKLLVEKFSALSLREQALALTINDTTRSYPGAPYEQVMLNLYSALNYLELGQPDAARVEVLQVDLRLAELSDSEVGALFENDPFARYLSGLIYELNGEYSDALIAYRRAYQAYRQHSELYPLRIPRQLQLDLLRSTERVGLLEENRSYQQQFGIDSWLSTEQLEQQGELIFIFHSGLAPVKVEQFMSVPTGQRGRWVRIAIPRYVRRSGGFSVARLAIAGRVLESELVENIEELAVAELQANHPAIIARAAARTVLKYSAGSGANQKNDWAGVVVDIVAALTERADTRSWMSLPAEIQLARVALPEGEYALEVELLDMAGRVARRLHYPAVVMRAGEKTFLSCHVIAENSLFRRRR